MADWSLREHARQIIDDSHMADPHLIARKVALSIPDNLLRQAVDEMIGAYVVGIITRSRWSAHDPTTSGQMMRDAQAVPAAGGDPSPPAEASVEATPSERTPRPEDGPTRWQAAAAHYKAILGERMATADGWKFLRDFTADDADAAAERRRDIASRNLSRADQLTRAADEVRQHGVPTIGDLPDDVLKELFG